MNTSTHIVFHVITGLTGTVRQQVDRYSQWDGEPGPWYFVEWDDGFTCWVPARVTLPALPAIA